MNLLSLRQALTAASAALALSAVTVGVTVAPVSSVAQNGIVARA
ncbi:MULTISPECIES: hypothetical protein [Sphingomonas]|nr:MULTISPECIES: hypothetical protein [Sphingomonas]